MTWLDSTWLIDSLMVIAILIQLQSLNKNAWMKETCYVNTVHIGGSYYYKIWSDVKPHSLKIEIQIKTNSHVVPNPIKINSLVAHHMHITYCTSHTTPHHIAVSIRKTSLKCTRTSSKTTRHWSRREYGRMWRRRGSLGPSRRIHQVGTKGGLWTWHERGGWLSVYLLWVEISFQRFRWWALDDIILFDRLIFDQTWWWWQ